MTPGLIFTGSQVREYEGIFVALCCIDSSRAMSFFWYGDQTQLAYSTTGHTYVVYAISLSSFENDFLSRYLDLLAFLVTVDT